MSLETVKRHTHRSLNRIIKTPKGILLLMFGTLAVLALVSVHASQALPNLIIAMGTAAAVDMAIVALRRDEWLFPDGAILTGLIVGFILRPEEPAAVVMLASTVAIVSKQIIRTRWSNILNPAAVGLVFATLVFHSGQAWWGALPKLEILGALLILGAGYYMADRINKLPMVLTFLGVYFGLFMIAGFFGNSGTTAEIFRTPDLQAALFFSFFMLDDPPTSPVRYEDQIVYGIIVATAAYFIFIVYGVVYYLPAALLAGNAWESARRLYHDYARKRVAVPART